MEPVDPKLEGLLGDKAAGGPDELRAIVAKSRRLRRRWTSLAALAVLAAGGGIGYGAAAVAGTASGSALVSTSAGPAAAPSDGASRIISGLPATVVSPKLTRLFTRQVGQIDIRAFSVSQGGEPFGSAAGCGMTGPALQAEVSTPSMVGIAVGSSFDYPSSLSGSSSSTKAVLSKSASVLGEREGSPVSLVVVQTSPAVAKLKMYFSSGASDEMAPVDGWAVLAAAGSPPGWTIPAPTSVGTVVFGKLFAFSSAGGVLAVEVVKWPDLAPVTGGGVATVPCRVSIPPCIPPSTVKAGIPYACATQQALPECTPPSTAKAGTYYACAVQGQSPRVRSVPNLPGSTSTTGQSGG